MGLSKQKVLEYIVKEQIVVNKIMRNKIPTKQSHGLAFISIMILMTFYSCDIYSQNKTDKTVLKDSLTWHIYIGGKPDMRRVKAKEKIARNWGVKINIFYGDCGGTYDYKYIEFEEKNKSVYEYLTNKYGINWREKFNKEVETEIELK
jgi:hypothetical protein